MYFLYFGRFIYDYIKVEQENNKTITTQLYNYAEM